MIMIGQSKRLAEPLRLTGGQRRLVLGLGLVSILAVIGLGIWGLTSSGKSTPRGCVEYTAASTTGAATFRACGRDAATYCGSALGIGALKGPLASSVGRQCRRAGYPVYARTP